MIKKPALCLFMSCLLFLPAAHAIVRDSIPPQQSRMLRFALTGTTDDTDRSVLNIFIREQDNGEPVLGATVLLHRPNPEQVHGKVTQWDGRCRFKVAPGTYRLRIQLTGMVTFEKEGIELLSGRQYDMELDMARMKPPVPSAKSQAGKN